MKDSDQEPQEEGSAVLHPLLAEFRSPRLEQRFRRALWPQQKRQIYLLAIIGCLLFAIGAYGDYLRLGAAITSMPFWPVRIGLIFLCALPALAAMINQPRLTDPLLFINLFVAGVALLYFFYLHGLDAQARSGTLFLMTIVCCLCAPLRLPWLITFTLLLHQGYLWFIGQQLEVTTYELVATTLKLATLDLIIIGYLWRHQRTLRINFWESLNRTHINAALKREVARRIDSEQMFRALTENSSNLTTILNEQLEVLYLSPSTYQVLGWSAPTRRKLSVQQIAHPEDLPAFLAHVDAALQQTGSPYRFDNIRIQHRQGHWLDVEGYILPMLDVPGVHGIVINYHDVSELKAAHANLTQLAFYDSLTKLPNRQLFRDRLERTVQFCLRHKETAALLFIDLDQFKEVNDTLGHEAGDQLLQKVAERLMAQVRKEDSVARLGGDEFTILLHRANSSAAEKVARNILHSLGEPVLLSAREVTISASIGIAMIPVDGEDSIQLMRYADLAMYSVKEQNRNGYRFFADEMNQFALMRMRLQDELKNSLARNEFQLLYQPQFALPDQRLIGFEALSRWNHPEEGLLNPDRFIDAMEQSGLIIEYGRWVVAETIAQGARLQRLGLGRYKMAINLSTRQLLDPGLIETLSTSLERHQFSANLVTVEMNESFLSQQLSAVRRVLWQLRKIGVSVAVDDFGSGYFSLCLLKELPIDIVKIDRRFIYGIPVQEDDLAITEAVIVMAHKLGLAVVAEGVESIQQLRFLLDHGCDLCQGYFFGASLPADQLPVLISDLTVHRSILPRAQLILDV